MPWKESKPMDERLQFMAKQVPALAGTKAN